MTEQERRALFFKVTGQVYVLASMGVYSAFCKGLEAGAAAEREACAKVCDEWESDEAFVANIADALRSRGKQ